MTRRRRLPLPRSAAGRLLLGLGSLVAGTVLVAAVVDLVAPNPSGPRSSSYATAPEGLAAYADLLEREGRPVRRLREDPRPSNLPPSGTLVVLDAPGLDDEAADALVAFAAGGGRVVAGGALPDGLPGRLAGADPAAVRRTFLGGRTARPLAPVPETGGLTAVETAGDGAWDDAGPALPVLGPDAGAPLLLAASPGAGRALLLADASPLQNRLLARADNAALGLALAGPRGTPVTFVESVHGFEDRTGLAALPARWFVVLGGLLLAALALMWARGRRLGPPELGRRPLPPPRARYVDALAATLRRARRPAEATAPVAAAARERLAARTGLPPGAPPEAVLAAARRAGLGEAEARALVEPPAGDDGVLAAGRALAALTTSPTPHDRGAA